MSASSQFIGIDLSESRLALAVHNSDYRFTSANPTRLESELTEQIAALGPELVLIENAGEFAPLIAARLYTAHLSVIVVDSASVRRFLRTQNRRLQDQRTKAELLADFASQLPRRPKFTEQAANDLSELLNRHEQLMATLEREEESLRASSSATAKEIRDHIFMIEKRIDAIDAAIASVLRSVGAWAPGAFFQDRAKAILTLVTVLLVAAMLTLPFWLVAYPPLLDYPNHLARGFILAHLQDPHFHFSEFYAADWGPYPYLTTDLIVIALQKVCNIFTAGRMLLSLCALSVPLAAWFLIRKANRGNELLIGIALIATYNVFFLWGFVNYQLSVALLLFLLALSLEFFPRPSPLRWAAILLTATALYFTHLMGFGIAGLLIVSYALLTRQKLRQLIFVGLTFAPGAILHLLFRVRSAEGWHLEFRSVAEKWDRMSVLVEGYSPRLDQITIVILVACCVAAWWRNREFRWNHPWPALMLGVLALYWIFPSGYGFGVDADIRLLPLALLFLPLVARIGRRQLWLGPILLMLFLARTANVTRTFIARQTELAGLAQSFYLTGQNARVLPMVEANDDDPQHRPYAHFWAYGVIARGWYSPYLFTEKGVIVLQDKLDLTSPEGFWDLEYDEQPEWNDIVDDYDYVWAYHVPEFAEPLSKIGEVVYQSGELKLYRIKKDEQDDSSSIRKGRTFARLHFNRF